MDIIKITSDCVPTTPVLSNTEHMDELEILLSDFGPTTPVLKWKRIVNSTGPQPKPRHGHRAVAIKELLIIFGGGNDGMIAELHVYDTNKNLWFIPKTSGDKPPGCAAFGFVVYNTRILTFGGMVQYGNYSNELYELDTNWWHWIKLCPRPPPYHIAPYPRIGHSFTLIGNKVYLFGGLTCDSNNNNKKCLRYLNDLYTLDVSSPDALAWDIPETVGVMPSPRESHTAVDYTDSRGKYKLIIYGGMSGHRLGDLWTLDIDTMSWDNPIALGHLPISRSLHTAVTIQNRMFIFGGWVPYIEKVASPINDKKWICASQMACLNLETMIWEELNMDMNDNNMPGARAGHCAAVIRTRMYMWSGRSGYKNACNNQIYCKDLWYLEVDKPQKCHKNKLIRASNSSLEIAWNSVPTADAYILQIQKYDHPADPATLVPQTIIDYSLLPFLTPELAKKYSNSSDGYQLEASAVRLARPNQSLKLTIDKVNQFLHLPVDTANQLTQLPQDLTVNSSSLINYQQFTSVTAQSSGNMQIKTIQSTYVTPSSSEHFKKACSVTPFSVIDNSDSLHLMNMASDSAMHTLATAAMTAQTINTTAVVSKQKEFSKPVVITPCTSLNILQTQKSIKNVMCSVNTTESQQQVTRFTSSTLQTSVAGTLLKTGSNTFGNQVAFSKPGTLKSNYVTLVKTSQGNLIPRIPEKILGTSTPNKNMQSSFIKIFHPQVNQQNYSIKNYKTMKTVDSILPVTANKKSAIVIQKSSTSRPGSHRVIIVTTRANNSGVQTSTVSQANITNCHNVVKTPIQEDGVSSDRINSIGSKPVIITIAGAKTPNVYPWLPKATSRKSNLTSMTVSDEKKIDLLNLNSGSHVVQLKNTSILNTFGHAGSTRMNMKAPSLAKFSTNLPLNREFTLNELVAIDDTTESSNNDCNDLDN